MATTNSAKQKRLKRLAAKVRDAIATLGFKTFVHEGEVALVYISGENGDDACDYYGEFRGGYPWINPKIEEAVKALGCRVDWENPGCLGVYEA